MLPSILKETSLFVWRIFPRDTGFKSAEGEIKKKKYNWLQWADAVENVSNFPIETTALGRVCTVLYGGKVAERAHVQLFYTPLWFACIDREKATLIALTCYYYPRMKTNVKAVPRRAANRNHRSWGCLVMQHLKWGQPNLLRFTLESEVLCSRQFPMRLHLKLAASLFSWMDTLFPIV